MNIKEIARRTGMSPSTVSRVVNGRRYVSADKRAKVSRFIEETGYVPNRAARSMVLKRSFTIGIVIPETFNMFQQLLVSVIERHMEAFGYHILALFAEYDGSRNEACLNKIKAESLDGIILVQEMKLARIAEFLAAERLPCIACTVPMEPLPSIHVDDRAAAEEAVSHLAALGHRRIALVTEANFTCSARREAGYRDALERAGIPAAEELRAVSPSFTADGGMQAARELLSRTRDFTALFAVTDEIALGAIRALADAGIRVPRDVSAAGFDDIGLSRFLSPSLTTVRQPVDEIGAAAAYYMHRRITGGGADECPGIVPHRLVTRESTVPAAPRGRETAV